MTPVAVSTTTRPCQVSDTAKSLIAPPRVGGPSPALVSQSRRAKRPAERQLEPFGDPVEATPSHDRRCFNSTVTSWANTGARDLHLELRDAITPGTRGVRELLLDALRDTV